MVFVWNQLCAVILYTYMSDIKLSNGVVHKVPADMRKILLTTVKIHEIWEDITPLARNEWICWVEDAKKSETRAHRLDVMIDKFKAGKRRPCCWVGCTHR